MSPCLPHIVACCGVLRRTDGQILIAQRPVGKVAAGHWEFPGGKIEPGETPREALIRELREELGVIVTGCRPLIRLRHAYSDRVVTLHCWLVDAFEGEPQGLEGQAFAWVSPSQVRDYAVLPTVWPILPAVALPSNYVFTRPDAGEDEIREGLSLLPAGALLRLRLPKLDDGAYERLAGRILPEAQALGHPVLLDRSREQALELGADGWHASSAVWSAHRTALGAGLVLESCSASNAGRPFWLAGSAHTREDLFELKSLGADFAVLGMVQPSSSHPGTAPLGWPGFADAVLEAGLPVYALGGLRLDDRLTAFTHGGQGIAGISVYWSRESRCGGSSG